MVLLLVRLITYLLNKWRSFPDFFSRIIGGLGERVGTYPRAFASVSFLLALFLATGLQRFKYITNNELLFVPHNSQGIQVCKKKNVVFIILDFFFILLSITIAKLEISTTKVFSKFYGGWKSRCHVLLTFLSHLKKLRSTLYSIEILT